MLCLTKCRNVIEKQSQKNALSVNPYQTVMKHAIPFVPFSIFSSMKKVSEMVRSGWLVDGFDDGTVFHIIIEIQQRDTILIKFSRPKEEEKKNIKMKIIFFLAFALDSLADGGHFINSFEFD